MQPNRTTPKDFFLYLFAAGTLYVSATTLVTLLWQLINRWLPQTGLFGYGAYGYDGVGDVIRWAVAILVVVFPAYLVTMWWIGKEVDREPGKREIWVRRWFVWATLFIAAVVVLADLAFLVYVFMGGEIALRFVMKALAVGVVAKAVFWYHWYLLRREPGTGLALRKGILVTAAAFVGAAVVMGIATAGSPGTARAQRNDQMRVNALRNMQWEVTNFWQQKQRLPESAEELVDPANPSPLETDPQTGAPYRYERRGDLDFALCATFETEAAFEESVAEYGYAPPMGVTSGGKDATWEHGAGETCFVRTIDPERYPPFNGTVPR